MLPFYRGRNVLNWVLINDEKEFGITVHHVDEGVDTGDIISQKAFPISEEDNYKTLLETAFKECSTLLYKSLILIKRGEHVRTRQTEIDEVGFYCGQRINGDEQIDWNNPSRDIHNLIRAVSKPGPEAYTIFENNNYRISHSKYFKKALSYKGIPGQILYKKNGYLAVKTLDTFIEICIETINNIKIGSRFS
jgi:methionyl-tRNA formyltransferase